MTFPRSVSASMLLINSSFCHVALVALMFGKPPVAARLALSPNENISQHVSANRGASGGFTITAQLSGGMANALTSSEAVSVDVVNAKPAVTLDTYIVLDDGTPIQFRDSANNILDDLLVSDVTTSAGRSGLAILAVNPLTHQTQGIIEQKGGKSMKLYQEGDGGFITVVEEEKIDMPAWECGVGKEEQTLFHRTLEDEVHDHHGHEERHTKHVSFITNYVFVICSVFAARYLMCYCVSVGSTVTTTTIIIMTIIIMITKKMTHQKPQLTISLDLFVEQKSTLLTSNEILIPLYLTAIK